MQGRKYSRGTIPEVEIRKTLTKTCVLGTNGPRREIVGISIMKISKAPPTEINKHIEYPLLEIFSTRSSSDF